MTIGYVFIIWSKFVFSLCWRVWSFFSHGSGVFYSDFLSLLIHLWFLWSQGQGRKNLARVEFSFLDPHIFFSLGNNTSAKDADLQRELPRVHFIRAANDWERMEGGYKRSSPYHIFYMQDKFSSAWGVLGVLIPGVLVQGDFPEVSVVLWFLRSHQELLKHMWHKSPYVFNFLYYMTIFALFVLRLALIKIPALLGPFCHRIRGGWG